MEKVILLIYIIKISSWRTEDTRSHFVIQNELGYIILSDSPITLVCWEGEQ